MKRTLSSISVALVTRNRPESLARALRSWRRQSVQPFEIVISDDSDEQMRPEIQRIASDFSARWIKGPRRGLYANRNHVASHCRGTHVLSADDDHEHPIDFLGKCHAALEEDPNSVWCIGEVIYWEPVPVGWAIPGELHLNGIPCVPRDRANSSAWSDGATICPKRVFDSGLCFSEAFRFGASYLEFGCLLHAAGQRIRELESTAVIHHSLDAARSYDIPVEECASTYFAVLMLGCVYKRGWKQWLLTCWYFVKQLLRRPLAFWRPARWALREKQNRAEWFRRWASTRRELIGKEILQT